jgi:uncharacterized membrane protein YdbT with pleckstrin-like domain
VGRVLGWLTDPRIGDRLLREEGEVIVEVVKKHWVVYTLPVLLVLGGLSCWAMVPGSRTDLGWFPLVLGAVLILWGIGRGLEKNIDQFVITNMRVFRVKGLLARSQATMPLGRILDITVEQPLHGRILGFGHFTFESAAQDQGMKDIRYVGHPAQRDLAIQRVVQRAGLRGPRVPN